MVGQTNDPVVAGSISQITAAIAGGVSPQSLITPLWERARALEPRLHAFAHLPDRAPEASTEGPLAGVAVAVKDLIDTADMPTAYGSPIYDGARPDRDAEIVVRLRALGATVLGKTVTTEFAWRHAGPTRNPWNLEHTPGGSSSGSAAAVAAGLATLALGTQTFGSVIRPAAFCGVVGFKPSFGALPRDGVHPLSPSLDHVGLFARRVADVAVAFPLLTGASPVAARPIEGIRVAALAPPEDLVSAEQALAFETARRRLAEAGARLDALELPDWPDRAQAAADVLVAYEAARSLGDLASGFPDKLSAVLAELLAVGIDIAETDYLEALGAQRELRERVSARLDGFDAILAVPAPSEAPKGLEFTGDARFCTPWTLLGLPAITVPVGLSSQGLPLGVQLVGRANADHDLIAVAMFFEAIAGFGDRASTLSLP